MKYSIYLSGEIHSDWRERIVQGLKDNGLDLDVYAPVTNHEASDEVGVRILGEESDNFWKDHKAAKINALRTMTLIEKADIVVVRFGEKYKQWNAAFDAGYSAAKGKSLIIMHDDDHQHALKEIDVAALAVVQNNQQLIEVLKYVTKE